VTPAHIGILDLSVVTDALITQITDSYDKWPQWTTKGGPVTYFTTSVSGSMPETVRDDGGCQLSLYLLHVKENGHLRNTPVTGQPGVVPFKPLALDLYYLLTAYSGKHYYEEQRAMSIAIRSLYEQPIVQVTVPIGGASVQEEFVLQMEIESADELGRVWQAFNTPFRLSAVYRVAVVFVSPEALAPTTATPQVTRVVVSANPDPAQGAGIAVLGTTSTVGGLAGDAELSPAIVPLSPATAPPGATFPFLLLGEGLADPAAQQVFLLPATGPERDVTGWKVLDPAAATDARLPLVVSDGPGAPEPGIYRLRVGSGSFRSNATVVSIAARVDPAPSPPPASPFTITGAGFVGAAVELLLGTVPLMRFAGAPRPGDFQVVDPATIVFEPPAGLPAGAYEVRVRVNGVEAPPTWHVKVP
jgi:hypothetical protein